MDTGESQGGTRVYAILKMCFVLEGEQRCQAVSPSFKTKIMTEIEIKTASYSILFHLGRDENVQSIDFEPQLNIEDLKFNRDILVKENDTISSLILHYWEWVQIENVYLEDAFNNAKDE